MSYGRRVCFLASTGMALIGGAAHAQSATAPSQFAEPEEIIVTAQKREQKVADVPMTITAASGAQLQKAGITGIDDLGKVVSGFTASTSLFGQPVYTIRGVGFASDQISGLPTVTPYIDEAPLPYNGMSAGAVLDLERVEVLKGPQGTLFGQNSTGGSVNFIAAKPTETLSAGIRTTINSFGGVTGEGFVSGPITDTLRVRIAANTAQGGDWQESYTRDDEAGGQNKAAGRLLVDWAPTSRLTFNLNVNGFYDKSDTMRARFHELLPNPGPITSYPLPPAGNEYADWDRGKSFKNDNSFYQATLRTTYDFDTVQLTSLTSFSRLKAFRLLDTDGLSANLLRIPAGGTARSFSQELRISGQVESIGLSYIAGVNYQNDRVFDFLKFNAGPNLVVVPPVQLYSRALQRLKSRSVFGNVDWDVAEALTLSAGVRYTSTRQTTDGCSADPGDGGAAAFYGAVAADFGGDPSLYKAGQCIGIGPDFKPFRFVAGDTDRNVSWRASMNYKPSRDLSFYATASRGYKTGLYSNLIAIFAQGVAEKVKQERLTALELGAKVSAPDSNLQFNVAGFYYFYKDKQLSDQIVIPGIGLAAAIQNIPHSTVKGFDADLTFRPVRGLTLRGAVNYTKTKIGKYRGFDATQNAISFKGNVFNFAPKWSANADVEYRFPVSSSTEAFLGASVLTNSHAYGTLSNDRKLRIPSYTTLDLRIGATISDRWEVTAFARNVTDTHYITARLIGTNITVNDYAGRPREFGASLGYRF